MTWSFVKNFICNKAAFAQDVQVQRMLQNKFQIDVDRVLKADGPPQAVYLNHSLFFTFTDPNCCEALQTTAMSKQQDVLKSNRDIFLVY